jgi:hypothetical protein
MKKIIFAISMIAAASCTKDLSNKSTVNSSITGNEIENSIIFPPSTNFGALILGDFTNDEHVQIAKNLNAKYVRTTIAIDNWKGRYAPYETYIENGIKVVLNVNCTSNDVQTAFPKNLIGYRQIFFSITNTYQPPVIVVENEEINPHYHSGPMTDYINMLRVALDVCHRKGIKVTNGGIYGPQLEVLTYRYLQTKDQKRADSFAENCMEKSEVKDAQNPGRDEDLEKKVSQLDTLLNFYPNLDYINVHLYEPFDPDVVAKSKVNTATPVVVADIREYLIARTGKPVITNETGQRHNNNPALVTSMLQVYDRLKFPYAIWYSGTGEGGCKPLHNLTTGALYLNGIAYSNFLRSY